MINGKANVLNIDSDYSGNLISDKKAAELKAEKYKIENYEMETTKGKLTITHAVDIVLDLGMCDVNITFNITNDNNDEDPIIIGSTSLKALNAVADFENNEMVIMNSYPIKMYKNGMI